MAWPGTLTNASKPSSTDWNGIVNALQTWGGNVNANNGNLSNLASIVIGDGGSNTYTFARDGPSGFLKITPTQNTFCGYFFKTVISNVLTTVLTIDNGGHVGIGIGAVVNTLQVRVGTDQDIGIYSNSGVTAIQATNDAVNVFKPLAIDGLPIKLGLTSAGFTICYVPNAVNTSTSFDSNLGNSNILFWVDESNNLLTFRVRYSGGTLKKGTVALV